MNDYGFDKFSSPFGVLLLSTDIIKSSKEREVFSSPFGVLLLSTLPLNATVNMRSIRYLSWESIFCHYI